MSFMQFQFDVVPAIVGVSIYVACQLLLKALAPRTKKAEEKLPKADLLTKDTELFDETFTEALQDPCDEPEPVPEPAAEPEASGEAEPAAEAALAECALPTEQPENVEAPAAPARVGASWLTSSWRALAVLLVISRVALPIWFQRGTDVVQEMPAGVEQPSNLTNLPLALETRRLEANPAEVVDVDMDMGDGQEAFSIKLTRQVMNDEDYVRSAYYGEVVVGSPPTKMTVVFDTGSGHLVLPSMYCKSETCRAHRRYRRSTSTTARDIKTHGETWTEGPRDSATISFGTGEITGVFVEDVVCMSHVTGAAGQEGWNESRPECMRLHFIAATELSEDPFKKFHFDGLLGLGLSGLSQTPNFNFMQVISSTIQSLGSRNAQTFGVFLSDHIYEESEIALGGWAKRHLKEDLSWGPIHDPELGHWIIPIRGIRIDNYRLDFCNDGGCRAAVDTGTSLVAVPTAAFREMYEQLRHPAPLSGHCRGFGPLLHIELERFTVSLGPKDYGQVKKTHKSLLPQPRLYEGKSAKGRKDLRCLPMLMTLDLEEPVGPKLFVLGEPVLRKYYTVYDAHRKQVGIGKARHVKVLSREELLEMAPDVEPVARRRMPTMFDVFRWRKALQDPARGA